MSDTRNYDPQTTDQFIAPEASKPVLPVALPFFLAMAVLFVMAYGGWTWWRVQQFERAKSEAISAPYVGPPLEEFELTMHTGEPFRSADMRGRVWVATYFFTTCPGNCIRLNQNIQLLHRLPELADVTWISITCDPDTDTVDVLDRYAQQWEADPEKWQFGRADLDYTKRVALGMNLYLDRKGHQDYAVVVDKAGKIRGMYDATSKSDCQRLRALLVECQAEAPPDDLAADAQSESDAGDSAVADAAGAAESGDTTAAADGIDVADVPPNGEATEDSSRAAPAARAAEEE